MSFRHRVIRFFISSTFADMEPERNIVAELLSELNLEYSGQGWSIEYIDLRWGVSKAESQENKTMQICLNELDYCKRISPRPNFIFLIGDRYGWIPLPEVLSASTMLKAKSLADHEECELLNRFYHPDYNKLPDGEYILCSDQKDNPLSESDIEILQRLFQTVDRMLYVSATELEILHGVFETPDARDHVIGYFRSLTDVPQHLKSIYTDNSANYQQKLNFLRNELINNLDGQKIVNSGTISFNDYNNPAYLRWFSNRIETALRNVIETEIESNRNSAFEYLHNLNIDHAEKLCFGFQGRRQELKQAMEYIESQGKQYPLLICAAPGTGKSSFIGKLIHETSANGSTIIVPIFGGLSIDAYDASHVIASIVKALYPYFSDEGRNKYPFVPDIYDIKSLFLANDGSWFHMLESLLRPGKYLIAIDALDRIIDKDNYLTYSLSRQPITNPYGNDSNVFENRFEKLRIIASRATISDDCRSMYDILPYDKLELNEFAGSDRSDLVYGKMKLKGRTLSQLQRAEVDRLLTQTDGRGLYLDTLSRFLSTLKSYDPVPNMPADFEKLVLMFLASVSNGHSHNSRLVRMTLALIVTSRKGIVLESINGSLAFDTQLMAELTAEGFHKFTINGTGGIPPILLSKLFADISDILTTTITSPLGEIIRIRHQETERVIKNWLTGEELRLAETLQYRYYRVGIRQGNLSALCNLPSLLIDIVPSDDKAATNELMEYLGNIDLIARRLMISQRDDIISDFKGLLKRLERDDSNEASAMEIRRLLGLFNTLPEEITNPEILKAWCYNLPEGFWLNRNSEKWPAGNFLKNVLLDYDIDNGIIDYGLIERNNVEIILENGTLIDIVDRRTGESRLGNRLDPEIKKMILGSFYSISPDSRYVAFLANVNGNGHSSIIIDLENISNSLFFEGTPNFRFSKTGNILWMVSPEFELRKLNIDSMTLSTIPIRCHQILDATDSSAIVTELFENRPAKGSILVYMHNEDYILFNLQGLGVIPSDGDVVYDLVNKNTFELDAEKIREHRPFQPKLLALPIHHISSDGKRVALDYQVCHTPSAIYSLPEIKDKIFHKTYIRGKISMSSSEDGRRILYSSIIGDLEHPIVCFQKENSGKWIKRNIKLPSSPEGRQINTSAISPDGRFICYASTLAITQKNHLVILQSDDFRVVREIETDNLIGTIMISKDSKRLVALDLCITKQRHPLKFLVLDMMTGESFTSQLLSYTKEITPGNFNFDIRLMSDGRHVVYDNLVLDLPTGTVANKAPLSNAKIKHYYSGGAFIMSDSREFHLLTDGGLIFSGGNGMLNIFDIVTRKTVSAKTDDIAIAISPDATLVLYRKSDHSLYTSDITMRWRHKLSSELPDNVMQAYFHPTKKAIYLVTRDFGIYFCDINGNILSRALATCFYESALSAEGLMVIRNNGQLSLYAPDAGILASLPDWEYGDRMVCEMFRQKMFRK